MLTELYPPQKTEADLLGQPLSIVPSKRRFCFFRTCYLSMVASRSGPSEMILIGTPR